jgi:hypothetical protein
MMCISGLVSLGIDTPSPISVGESTTCVVIKTRDQDSGLRARQQAVGPEKPNAEKAEEQSNAEGCCASRRFAIPAI